jgi:hypothetical protein
MLTPQTYREVYVRVTPDSVERALWLFQRLIKLLAERGVRTTKDPVLFSKGKEQVSIGLTEVAARFSPDEPTPDGEGRVRLRRNRTRPIEWTGSGVLRFSAEKVAGIRCGHEWRDKAMTPLDDQLPHIADCIVELVDTKPLARAAEARAALALAERQRIAWEEAARAAERRRQQELEAKRAAELLSVAKCHDEARLIRQLIDDVRAANPSETLGLDTWLSWADEVGDRLDRSRWQDGCLRPKKDASLG